LDPETVSDVLQNLVLSVCRAGVDGRSLTEWDFGVLQTLAAVARDLDLPDAGRFQTLLNVARKGQVKDLHRAAMVLFTGE
jgi:hypothetical protein